MRHHATTASVHVAAAVARRKMSLRLMTACKLMYGRPRKDDACKLFLTRNRPVIEENTWRTRGTHVIFRGVSIHPAPEIRLNSKFDNCPLRLPFADV